MRIVWSVLLMVSLAANAYLWLTRPTGASASDQPPAALELATSPAPAERRPLSPARPARPVATDKPDRVDQEQRLAAVEQRLLELRRPDEIYKASPRSAESEARAKIYLDKIFGGLEPAATYTVECHGNVCKVASERPEPDWIGPLQTTFPGREQFGSMQFGLEGTFIALMEPDRGEGRRLYYGIREAWGRSATTRACMVENPAKGGLALGVELAAGRVRASAQGELSAHPVAGCLVQSFEEAARLFTIPPEITSLPDDPIELTFPVDLPPEGR